MFIKKVLSVALAEYPHSPPNINNSLTLVWMNPYFQYPASWGIFNYWLMNCPSGSPSFNVKLKICESEENTQIVCLFNSLFMNILLKSYGWLKLISGIHSHFFKETFNLSTLLLSFLFMEPITYTYFSPSVHEVCE